MSFATAWVRSPQMVPGQDHLGVLATSENLYSQLLPGITNLTERARLYSFYPWVLWAHRQQGLADDAESSRSTLRRAECLLTLIGARHAHRLGLSQNEDRDHGNKLVGRRTLLPALTALEQGESLSLEALSAGSEEGGYFKHSWGGFGQYYSGTLLDLGLVESDGQAYWTTDQCGELLAQALDESVDRRAFFKALSRDRVSLAVVDSLADFCPCALGVAQEEQALLTDLFFNRPGPFKSELGANRRSTLGVLLDLASVIEGADVDLSLSFDVFSAAAYSDSLSGDQRWDVVPAFRASRSGWRFYWFGELISFAVQSLFWAALSSVGVHGRATSTRALAEYVLTEHFPTRAWHPALSFAAAVETIANELPARSDWGAAGHEIQLAWGAFAASRDGDIARVVETGIALLLALAARAECGDIPHLTGFLPPNEYAGAHSINPRRFLGHAAGTWRELTVRDFALWVLTWWGVDAHIRVALRKLRYSSRDTFQVRPVESGLQVEHIPPPNFSSPRYRQAIQILRDLGALAPRYDEENLTLTESGRAVLEELRG